MWRRLPGHGPGLSRPARAAAGAARGVRGHPRRKQCAGHHEGRSRLRPRTPRLPQGARGADRSAAAVDRVLELQPLPGDRRFRRHRRSPQRPGTWPVARDHRRVRRGVHGRRAELREGSHFHPRRARAEPDQATREPDGRPAFFAALPRHRRRRPRYPGPGHPHPDEAVHRRLSRRSASRHRDALAACPGFRDGTDVVSHLGPTARAVPVADQAEPDDDQRVRLARLGCR